MSDRCKQARRGPKSRSLAAFATPCGAIGTHLSGESSRYQLGQKGHASIVPKNYSEYDPKIVTFFGLESDLFQRLCKHLLSNSFFLFGARGTGKSTLVNHLLTSRPHWKINLLDPAEEERFSTNPSLFAAEARARAKTMEWIFIDEVQKIPAMLDIVHDLIESPQTRHLKFALTGSSARKLKVAGANLLAGRAFLNELYPLSFLEMQDKFDQSSALSWGSLPKISDLSDDLERQEFLKTYCRVYLKEEVWDERLVQNLDPFRKFLPIAAQTSGKVINFLKMSRQTGVDDKTVKKYFEILVDTFLGFYLEAFDRSVRIQQVKSPKFYLFDTGIKRTLEGHIRVPVVQGTSGYGELFEHLVVGECVRLNSYLRLDYRFSYLLTKAGQEIDLIIERPGRPSVLVELKSDTETTAEDSKTLRRFSGDFRGAMLRVWSNCPRPLEFDGVLHLPWQAGIKEVFELQSNS